MRKNQNNLIPFILISVYYVRMKKVLLQTYTVLMFFLLIVAAVYTFADISQLISDRATSMEPYAAYVSSAVLRGEKPSRDQLQRTVSITLQKDEKELFLYRNRSMNHLAVSLLARPYVFPVGTKLNADNLVVTYQLVEQDEVIRRLRILLFITTGVLLVTGLIIAFYRQTPVKYTSIPPQAVEPPIAAKETLLAAEYQPPMMTSTELVPGEQLTPRLQSELKRAASFDQDLVLAVIQVEETEDNEDFLQLAREIRAFFFFKDLCYQYGNNKAYVILPNSELDEGIRTLKDFRNRLDKATPPLSFTVGLSARSGRLLEGETLIRECEGALRKSIQDGENTITGFRADPTRFRAVMS